MDTSYQSQPRSPPPPPPQQQSLVFRIDDKLLQRRPPRLTLAGTLAALCKQVRTGQLDANFVVDILSENRLLPYMISNSKNISDVSLGRNTNASKVGDIIVSEECIKGTYELCIVFLEFVHAIISNVHYRDTTRSMLASLTYVVNEVYTSHHIWTYKRIDDMNRILSLCTEILYFIISNLKEPNKDGHGYSEMELVTLLSLGQNQAHRQLLDVIIQGKGMIEKQIKQLNLNSEMRLRESPVVQTVRQSLFIFNKILTHSRYIKDHCDITLLSQSESPSAISHYQHGASSSTAPMTNIERALFDTNIRPGLLQNLFSYIYLTEDSKTACLAVELIENVAKKFTMSLMASLGSEAERVCEFFVDCLASKEANVELEVAILNLLSTCVKHQPGLIELVLNLNRDSTDASTPRKSTLSVVMDLFKECRARNEDAHRKLHTIIMKFMLTFWQKHHSAIEQLDKAEQFWESVAHPLNKFLKENPLIASNHDSAAATASTPESIQALNDHLISYALMLLAREIFCLNAGLSDRKMNPALEKIMSEFSSTNLLGNYSTFVRRRYSMISAAHKETEDVHNCVLSAWKDFLCSFVKHKPFEIGQGVKNQIVEDLLACTTAELRLEQNLNRERMASLGDTLLLTWTKWMQPESQGDERIFNLIHEIMYLVDSSKEYLPFSFLLTFQSALNLYCVRHRDYLIKTKRSFDLLVPALQLVHFSVKIMEKYLNSQSTEDIIALTSEFNYKPRIEQRLCLASIMSLRFVIDVSRKDVSLWLSYLQTNLQTDSLVQFLTLLMNKRIGPEICLALVELLLCLSSIRETASYLNKAALISQVNVIAVSAYERPYAHLSQLASHHHSSNSEPNDCNGNSTTTASSGPPPVARTTATLNNHLITHPSTLVPGLENTYITPTGVGCVGGTFLMGDSSFLVGSAVGGANQMANSHLPMSSTLIANGTIAPAPAASPLSTFKSYSQTNQRQQQHQHQHQQQQRQEQQQQQPAAPSNSNHLSEPTKLYLENVNSVSKWLPIYCHVIRLNISIMLTLGRDFMPTAIEFLSIHCIRICELLELLRTRPRSVQMEEALQTIYLINLTLRFNRMWLRQNKQSYEAIADEVAKTAYTLATSALPPPQTLLPSAHDSPRNVGESGHQSGQQRQQQQQQQHHQQPYQAGQTPMPGDQQRPKSTSNQTSSSAKLQNSLKPRDCLVYARCCYDFARYTEAERVLFQTRFGDKQGFIKEAGAIYGEELGVAAFHLAALICLKTNRRSDAIDFALQVFADNPEHLDIVSALSQSRLA